jgi:hypothetical protein
MRTSHLLLIFVLVTLAFCGSARAEDGSFLPTDAVNVKIVAAPDNGTMAIIEQSGLVPYKGHGASDASTAFETGEDGTQYGNNEYTKVSLSLMQYSAAAKEALDQMLQIAHPSLALQQEEESAKSGGTPHGDLLLSRSVNRLPVDDGEMLLITDAIKCVESQYPSYVQTTWQSYAVSGTSIIKLSGTYNSTDAKLARRIHKETVANIKKSTTPAE